MSSRDRDRDPTLNPMPPGITPFPEPAPGADPVWGAGAEQSRPRVLLYSHDSAGLGHTRRTLAVAEELARRRPDAAILWVTGSPHLGAYRLPSNLDFLKMPWTGLRGAYAAPEDLHPRVNALRFQLMETVVLRFEPHLVVVDFLPDGMRGELGPALMQLRGQRDSGQNETTFVLTLRDIIDEPRAVSRRWYNSRAQAMLEDVYDRILVYGSQEVFDLAREYGWSPGIARKLIYCGYIARRDPLQPAEAIRAQLGLDDPRMPLVVVTVGGGWDGEAVIGAYLEAIDRHQGGLLPQLVSFVSTGPSLDPLVRERFAAQATRLERVTLVPFTPDMMSYFNAADLVISMGGFNSVGEILSLGRRLLVIPRTDQVDREQQIRAERLAARGDLTVLPSHDLTPDDLAATMRRALASEPPQIQLDFGGLQRAGEILADMLDPA